MLFYTCNTGKRLGLTCCLAAFYMVGDFESARAKGEKILADLQASS
jgi:hypothetical protein